MRPSPRQLTISALVSARPAIPTLTAGGQDVASIEVSVPFPVYWAPEVEPAKTLSTHRRLGIGHVSPWMRGL